VKTYLAFSMRLVIKVKELIMPQSTSYKTATWQPRNLLWFVLIAFGWTWFWWGLFIFDVLKMPAEIGTPEFDLSSAGPILGIVILSPFGPTIAGFFVTARTEGQAGVKRLWKSFWNRNLHFKWLLVLLLFFPLKNLILRYSAQVIVGTTQPSLEWLSQPWLLLPPFIASIIHGGLSEEFGWRGYALPRFQAKFNALTAALVLGLIEGCWHIPLVFMPGDERFGMVIPVLILPYFATGIFRAWIFNNTGGSVLAAVLFHAAGNTAGWAVPANVPSQIFADLIYFGLAVVVVLIFGSKDLIRNKSNVQDEATPNIIVHKT
jgi:membrane protease YdiL (CAAX protease family)